MPILYAIPKGGAYPDGDRNARIGTPVQKFRYTCIARVREL